MSYRLLPLLALITFVSAPIVMGIAEPKGDANVKTADAKPADGKGDKKIDSALPANKNEKAGEKTEQAPKKKFSNECLASEEVIADLEAREKKLQEKEESLKEREKEIAAQESAVKEELNKLEAKKTEIQGSRQKDVAAREEQVNKLMETFEGMSPKAAAQVLGAVDDDLAVMALGRLSSLKAGKILSNLKPEKSAKLSERMAFGKTSNGKEGGVGEAH